MFPNKLIQGTKLPFQRTPLRRRAGAVPAPQHLCTAAPTTARQCPCSDDTNKRCSVEASGSLMLDRHLLANPHRYEYINPKPSSLCEQVVIKHLDDAHEQLDRAIAAALRQRKPVYINIACNLGGAVHPSFARSPIPFSIVPKASGTPPSVPLTSQGA